MDLLKRNNLAHHVDANGVKISEFPWLFVSSNVVIKVDEDKPPIIGGCRSR